MKVIQVAGLSGSGKTTFIAGLIPYLNALGATAVVKHTGHHRLTLEEGKDTTRFFTEGAHAASGVDDEKYVLVVREPRAIEVLKMLSAMDIRFAIIEGFKSWALPRAVIGDLPAGKGEVVLTNPTPEILVASLDRFPDFFTPEGLARALRSDTSPAALFSGRWDIGDDRSWREVYHRFSPIEKEVQQAALAMPGAVRARVHLHNGHLFGGSNAVLMAVGADSPHSAMEAFSALQDKVTRGLE